MSVAVASAVAVAEPDAVAVAVTVAPALPACSWGVCVTGAVVVGRRWVVVAGGLSPLPATFAVFIVGVCCCISGGGVFAAVEVTEYWGLTLSLVADGGGPLRLGFVKPGRRWAPLLL